MNRAILLGPLLHVVRAVAEETAAKNAIADTEQVVKCTAGKATCATYTDFEWKPDMSDVPAVGSIGFSFGSAVDTPGETSSIVTRTVNIDMAIPLDPVFLVEIFKYDTTPSLLVAQPDNNAGLEGIRWGQSGDQTPDPTSNPVSAGASPFACPPYDYAASTLTATANVTMLSADDFKKWDAKYVALTSMLLSKEEVKQGFFDFKGVSRFPCAICALNTKTGNTLATGTQQWDLWLSEGEKAITLTAPSEAVTDDKFAFLPEGSTSYSKCTADTHPYILQSNTPGIFKAVEISAIGLKNLGAYGETDYLQPDPQTAPSLSMKMNRDFVHVKQIKINTAPQATVTLQTLPDLVDFYGSSPLNPVTYVIIAVQAGLYNLGGFFNASADAIKAGIKFGFTDITTEDDTKEFGSAGFIHYQYLILCPSDLVAATIPTTSTGLAIGDDAACQAGDDTDTRVKSAATVQDLIHAVDRITYTNLAAGDETPTVIANNFGFVATEKELFNSCSEIGGASMYVFADAHLLKDTKTQINMPWLRGLAISDVTANDLGDLIDSFEITDSANPRVISLDGVALGASSDALRYPIVMLNYAISHLQMNGVDEQIIGAVPFVSTDAPGQAWVKAWKFQEATGLSGVFSDANPIKADFTETPAITYHIGGGSYTLLIIILSIVGVLILAGVGYYFYTNKGDGAQAASAGSVADDTDEA